MRAQPRWGSAPKRSKPSAFQIIFALNIGIFILQHVLGIGMLRDPLTDSPVMPMGSVSVSDLSDGHFWTLFTHMFVHGSLGHVLMNMLLLWFAGRKVANLFGGRHFVQIYFVAGVVGAAVEMAVGAYGRGDLTTSLLGASGAVFGLLTALAVALPDEEVTALLYFVIPVRMRLITLTFGIVALNVVMGIVWLLWPGASGGTQIAWFAHLGGALAGWYYARALGYDGTPIAHKVAELQRSVPAQRPRAVAHARQRQPVIDLELDVEAIAREPEARTPKASLMEDIDPILDKINDLGMSSLDEDERRTLERACREMKNLGDSN
jgi:membrane associated rhomboid family serine protease